MILLDTSAVYAIADVADPNHTHASERLQAALGKPEAVLIHNYVILESVALIQRRLGLQAAIAFLKGVYLLQVHWVTQDEHQEAVEMLELRNRRTLSLVDCVSFVVMKERGITTALAYDSDFDREGFHTRGRGAG